MSNPANHPRYQETLKLLPTLRSEVSRIFEEKSREAHVERGFKKENLPDNSLLASKEALLGTKVWLIDSLKWLLALNKGAKPITIVTDTCFTNALLEIGLLNILGIEGAKKYIEHVRIDYEGDGTDIPTTAFHNNSLIILGGSFSDAYTIHRDFYNSEIAQIIRDSLYDSPDKTRNNRIIGVCFGQQFIANILGSMQSDSPQIIATIKGAAQFMPSICDVNRLDFVPKVYKKAFDGITNSGKNTEFSTIFTRTGHVDFDLMNSGRNLGIVPLVTDRATGDIVGWGTKNGHILGVQFHPEIRFSEDKEFLIRSLQTILPGLKRDYGSEAMDILGNFDLTESGKDIQSISEHFYAYAINAFIEDIVREQEYHEITGSWTRIFNKIEYTDALKSIITINRKRIDYIVKNNKNSEQTSLNFDESSTKGMLHKLDMINKLVLNARFDWKVNRGIIESSEVLGIYNIVPLVEDQLSFLQEKGIGGPYIFRDWGAGNGTLLKELYGELKGQDIIFYGVGDNIYFDLYQGLKQSHFSSEIPNEILALFTQKVIIHYDALRQDSLSDLHCFCDQKTDPNACKQCKTDKKTLYSYICRAVQLVELNEEDIIFFSSMFAPKTYMFDQENKQKLSSEAKQFLRNKPEILNRLKEELIVNFYDFFDGFFERIYISDFNHFSLPDKRFESVDMQTSIRSTSHVDSVEYMEILTDYLQKNIRPGSILLENGVHRSYSSVPRIRELSEIKERFDERVSIQFIYDTQTNYFCSAIIEQAPFHNATFFEKHLREGMILVPLAEASESTFFRFETFLRLFILSSFRDYKVFFHFNKEIINLLKKSLLKMADHKFDSIKQDIVGLVNEIVVFYNAQGKKYDIIDIDILNEYHSQCGENINKILNRNVILHDWMNIYAERRY